MVDPEKLTIKSRQAIGQAQALAGEMGHQEVDDLHLLLALVSEKEGLVPPLLQRLGVRMEALTERITGELRRRPGVAGAEQYPSSRLTSVLESAFQTASDMGDEYVSVEHLLLAILEAGGPASSILSEFGVNPNDVLAALEEVRGAQRVTDENPEEKYQALDRFTRDLTAEARRGKLDPVIGRDDEIRRVIQVLSRRTKNNPVLIGDPGVGKTAPHRGR